MSLHRAAFALLVLLVLALLAWTIRTIESNVPATPAEAVILSAGAQSAGHSKCGEPTFDPDEAQFIGRKEAVPHSWPWTVSIRHIDNHRCGGAIYNEKWIVTSASCVTDILTSYTIEAGRHCRDCDELMLQRRFVAKIVRHPSFSKEIGDFNLALVKLDQPFAFNSRVSPICLARDWVSDAASCVATGWGTPDTKGMKDTNLQQVVVPIVPNQLCGDFMHYDDAITHNMVCAGYEQSTVASCQSDSGGPLVCKSDGVWYMHGVTSWGDGCARARRPGVYTCVHLYADWIQQVAST